MIFEQVNGTKGTNYAEMRAYMLRKLRWNPYLNTDSLMLSFLNGYYVRRHLIFIGIIKLCKEPPWHYGVGYPAWFFINEVVVL